MHLSILIPSFTLSLLFLAMIQDIKTNRISNLFSLIGIMGTLMILILTEPWEIIRLHLLSFLILFVITLIGYRARVIGGGDAKILSFVALTVPFFDLLTLCLCITISGGIQALISIIYGKIKGLPKTIGIPYGVAVFVGTLGFWMINFLG